MNAARARSGRAISGNAGRLYRPQGFDNPKKRSEFATTHAPDMIASGVVFSGSMDGHLRAYDAAKGGIIWDFDTLKDFQTVDGVKARGGSLNGAGVTVVGGMVYSNSGYARIPAMAGNVLLAFSVDGK